ncbi:unnamed protein product [Clonostachys rosea]|uniref:Glutamine amidotransferase domain-containing protein n=1 Tax=Bionectria ochroleuca TaxID=29856 RepID=A0ABY6U6Y5_BIOOC|nr:unnamed protein product [Clonostachys rosea]
MAVEKTLSIAVLNCGYTCQSIQEARGQYHDLFAAILQPAAQRANRKATDGQHVKLEITGWDTVNQVYPPSLDGIDAIIISGSPNSAYDQLEWIQALNRFVADVYLNQPDVKIYGSCFGHQVVCYALFTNEGAVVKKDPAGWELGVRSVQLTDYFVSKFPNLLQDNNLLLQYLHADSVFFGPNVPKGVYVIGTTAQCQNQGIYQQGRLLTLQGHPEFDQFIEEECLKLVGKRVGWQETFLEDALVAARIEDDAPTAADLIVQFFLEG